VHRLYDVTTPAAAFASRLTPQRRRNCPRCATPVAALQDEVVALKAALAKLREDFAGAALREPPAQ
jgi:hypothetical protein